METNKFDVFDIYSGVFGYKALPFPQGNLNNLLPNPAETLSKIGAVLFKRDENGTEAFCPVSLSKIVDNEIVKTYDLPYSTITVSMRKVITATPLIARQGSVKELIQIGDYRFSIKGVIMGDLLPEDPIQELNEMFKLNEPLRLHSAFAELFLPDENRVVVESIDFPDMKGFDNSQVYTINIISDSVLTLEEV